MAWAGNNTGDEFSAGHTPLANAGRSNDNSVTLGDQGLDQTSARWDGITPHSVLASTVGGGSQDDGSFERVQRDAGSYQPGSMETFQDQLGQGSDDNTP
jgi:hypothetical protein